MSELCFFIFILIFTFILYTIDSKMINTGTVLFTSSDVHRQCWHPEEIGVLTTRMILQDLLPEAGFLEISDNDYVDDVVDYFRLLIDVVQKSTKGRWRHITMLALTDLIGGYLHHIVLPSARYAYYAGIIDFLSMEKLIQLFEEIKWFLRTNGQGWAGPLVTKTEFEIQTIDLSNEVMKGNKSCCRNLIYYQRSPIKRSADSETSNALFFPIPYFDSKVRPSAIAVPFKRYALRNIESKKAAYMIMKYYVSAENCLTDLKADKMTVENFQNNLYTWIEKNVMPKLKDDKFYSAFGGILRVEESLKVQGARIVGSPAVGECAENEVDQELGTVPGGETTSRSSVLLIVMIVVISLWFVIGTLFICYRIRKNSRKATLDRLAEVTTDGTSSSGSSKWSSSKRSIDACRCYTGTEKSTEMNSSLSSEFDKDYDSKGEREAKKSSKSFGFWSKSKKQPQQQPPPAFSAPCLCEGPPIIDPKHSVKVLPSIQEMSENSSSKRDDWNGKPRRISFDSQGATSWQTKETRKTSKFRVCAPKSNDIEVKVCPRYDDKATSHSSSRSKSTNGIELGTQKSELVASPEQEGAVEQKETSNENTTEETTDNTGVTNSPHMYACHSSLTGNYRTDQKFHNEKPFIFGYDFQTSTSSDLSDEESDAKTSTTK